MSGELKFDNYTHEEFQAYLMAEIMPGAEVAIPVIILFSILLVVGLIGNTMVIFVVFRNRTMRTPTNIFLVNLAVADFLVLTFCLPLTIVWELTKTWWFGTIACKAMMFLQPTIVYVSVLTMVAISVERWYAICCVFKPKLTLGRTLQVLAIIWIVAIVCGAPEYYAVESKPWDFTMMYASANFQTTLGTTCGHGDQVNGEDVGIYNQVYWTLATVVMFILPLAVVGFLYGKIAYVLWVKSIPPGHQPHTNEGARQHSTASTAHRHDKHIVTRRKAAKMLIAVVILFALSYTPVVAMNMLRAWKIRFFVIEHITYVYASRWVMYLNSTFNPVIYNFMSEKFRREFARAFSCQPMSTSTSAMIAERHRSNSLMPPSRRCSHFPSSGSGSNNLATTGLLTGKTPKRTLSVTTHSMYAVTDVAQHNSASTTPEMLSRIADHRRVNAMQVPTGTQLRLPNASNYRSPTTTRTHL